MYKKLSNEELNDFTSRVVVQLDPSLTQQVMSLILELSEYRTKIENGTLRFLPYKVGDIFYKVIKGLPIQEWKIESICFNETYPTGVIWAKRTSDFAHWKFWIEDFGKTIFLDKAKAEKKLLELRGRNER